MSRFALVAVACLVVLAGCLSAGSPACPAIGPDGERVDDPVCPDERAGGLSLSLERDAETVRVTATNVGDGTVPVNPDQWVVFRNAAERGADAPEWETAANAPAGTHNLTVRELPPGETETWEVRYDPTAPDASDRRDAVLDRPGEYVFSLGADGRTYVVSFRIAEA
ncbi:MULTISPECIES: hypothetical protein [Halorubrum]|uniref:Uncharacterized protein n=1 Tax=Halorubrum ruber TaxID=2982524 RepID=A0A8T8LNT6_9EURY|nr:MULTISPECIES: hypothetical protein [Halorubrum]QUO48747.1 hypothetical protein J7656_05200 [Halorubrum ruber]